MLKILIVNDQSLSRLALHLLLAAEPDLTVVGEAPSAKAAVDLSAALGPDVVVMDGCPTAPGDIDAIRRIARLAPTERPPGCPPRVLVLAAADQEQYARAALRAGAGGCLLPDLTPGALTAAIRALGDGDAVLTPSLTRTLIETVREQRTPSGAANFTRREHDVLALLAAGFSNAEIAGRLVMSETTAKKHVGSILAKLGARARVQAVVYAYESGLVRPAA